MDRLSVPCDVIELSAGHALVVWTIAPTGTIEERWQVYRKAAGKDDGQNIIGGSHPGTRAEATQIAIDKATHFGLVKKVEKVG